MAGMKFKKSHSYFSEDYKENTFNLWWSNHQPSPTALQKMIPASWGEKPPAIATLQVWIHDRFKERAVELDRKAREATEAQMIQEKIEMLYRHGEVGKTMQLKAMDALNNLNFMDFSETALLRFLVEGVRIERESVGLPQALEKLIDGEDEDLLDRIEKLREDSQAEVLVLDDGETD